MKLLNKGAEADIYLTLWNGNKSVLKIREKKDYRNTTLDRRIREQRTMRESSIMSDIKSSGVCSPLVYYVDTKMSKIYMQYMEGKLVRDLSNKKVIKACEEIGKIVGKLH